MIKRLTIVLVILLACTGCSFKIAAPGFDVEYTRGNFGGIYYKSVTPEGTRLFSTGSEEPDE